MKPTKYIIILVFSIFIINSAKAGWVISETSSDNYGNKQFQTTFIQNNLIRFETQTSVAIIDLNTSQITLIFGYHKLYWQGTIEEFRQGTIEVLDKKLNDILATAEPEQKEVARELIQQVKSEFNNKQKLADSLNLKVQIKETGKLDSISGFNSKEYKIIANDKLVETIWVSTDISPYEEISLQKMISFTKQLNPNNNNLNIEGSEEYLALIKNGLAMKSIKAMDDITTTTVVTNAIETKINNEIFLAPAEYRKAELLEIMILSEQNTGLYKMKDEFNKAKQNPFND